MFLGNWHNIIYSHRYYYMWLTCRYILISALPPANVRHVRGHVIHQSAIVLQHVASQASTPQMFVDVVRFVFLHLNPIFSYSTHITTSGVCEGSGWIMWRFSSLFQRLLCSRPHVGIVHILFTMTNTLCFFQLQRWGLCWSR